MAYFYMSELYIFTVAATNDTISSSVDVFILFKLLFSP